MKPQKKNFSTSVLEKATAFVLAISLCVSNLAMPVEAKETVNNVSMKETITEQTNSKEVYSEEKAETYMVRTPEDGMAPVKDFDYYYSERVDGMVIEYYRGNETEVVIPNEIEGEPVKEISNEAFYGNEKIISIEIPANVIDIMDGTFSECLNLMEIKVDSENRYYSSENGVLYDKNKTTIMSCPRGKQDYEFLASVTNIGDYAFFACSNLTNMEIPSNVISIGMSAFGACSKLISIEIPSNVVSIGMSAFGACSNLISIEIPSSVIYIGDYAFKGCYGMTIYCSENTEAHRYANENDLSVWFGKVGTKPENIPEKSTEDGTLTYRENGDGKVRITRYNGDETEVVIPSEINGKRVISIGDIFWNNQKVKNIKIPSSVIEIKEIAFIGCERLVEIEVDENNPNYSSEDGVLYDKNKSRVLCCPREKQEYKFLSSVASIGDYAFYGCSNLTNIEIPSNVVNIGGRAFGQCSGLTNVKIAEGLKSIGGYAFWDCSSLMNIEIPSGVIRIDAAAFERCSSLLEIEIPISVRAISNTAFAECSSLKHIELPAGIVTIGFDAFRNCSNLESITIPEGVHYIEKSAFEGCPELTICGVEGSKAYTYASENSITFIEKNFAESENNKFEYESGAIEGIKITGYTGIESEIVIPTEIDGKIVTEIGEGAFADNDNLTSVEIPYRVWKIGDRAFLDCSNLVSVKIPDGLTSISREAFCNCSSLVDIEIPSSISFVGDNAFENCKSLTSITIPSEVSYIRNEVFLGCSNLKNIQISEGVEYIDGRRVFAGCNSLTRIELPASIRIIKNDAFVECNNLMEIDVDGKNLRYSSEDGILYDKNKIKLIYCPYGKEEYAFLPNIKEISDWVFYGRLNLTSIEIPEGVTSIGDYAFYECSNLEDIKIPETVMKMGEGTFLGCSNLKTVNLPSGMTSIPSALFRECNNLINIEIPEGITSIGEFAFYGCCNLDNIKLPEGITNIEYGAFGGCSNLTEVEIPEKVTKLSDYLFAECSNLQNVKISKNVTHIGEWTFLRCGNLAEVEIPSSVIHIGDYAFNECYDMTIYCTEGSVAHQYAKENYIYFFLGELGTLIKGQEFWYRKKNNGELTIVKYIGTETEVEIPSKIDGNLVTAISKEAFLECNELYAIEIPLSVTDIDDRAFYDCEKLNLIYCVEGSVAHEYAIDWSKKVWFGKIGTKPENIQEEVTEDGRYGYTLIGAGKVEITAYYGEEEQTEIPSEINGKKVVSMAGSLFKDCIGLKSIIIPEGVVSMESYVFWRCTNLESVNLPKSLKFIGGCSFSGCESIKNIEIPKDIVSIGEYAFKNCKSLINMEIPEGVKNIDVYEMFSGCSNLKSVKLPSNLTSIGMKMFFGCTSLETIEIPEAVTDLDSYFYSAFQNCSSLKEINVDSNNKVYSSEDGVLYDKDKTTIIFCPSAKAQYKFIGSVNSIGDSAFRDCSNFTSIEIPEGVIEIGSYAFSGCEKLENIKISKTVSNIGQFAFSDCKSLTEIEIPVSVINIGADGTNVFIGCNKLEEINVDPNNEEYSSQDGVLYNKKKNTIICCPGGKENYEFLDSVTSVGESAFEQCTKLKYIELPSNVVWIDYNAFSGCSALREVKLSENIEYIAPNVFKGCNNLEKVEIPPSVNYIDEDVFLDCPNVTIYCTEGSVAHQYAIKYGIPFVLTDASFRVTLSSVVNGTTVSSIANLIGGGAYNKGETVTVTAPEKVGYNFIGWFAKDAAGTTYVVENALSTENTYTFTAADTDLVAVYVPDGKVALTVTDTTNVIIKDINADTVLNNGIGVTPGTKITVTYDLQEGEEFLYWKNASGKVVSTDTTHIFTLVNNTTLTPVVKSADAGKLLVEYLNEYNQVLSVEVWTEEGTLSPITPSKLGYICSGWTLELNATETISADKIWEKSADGYIKLYPVYEKVTEEHTITYKNNSAEAIAQTTTVELGATYTVNAEDVAVEGQKFSHWTIGNEIVSYNTSYTFLVTGDITVTAVFVAEETIVEKESILEITSQYEIKNGDTVEKVAFVASREIAEGYTLLEHGMLYAKDSDITDANGFIEGVEGVNKFTASGTGMKGAFTLNVRLGNATSLKVRAYAIVKNNTTGEVTTLYSGMNTYNKNN